MTRFHTTFHKLSYVSVCLFLALTCSLIYAQEEAQAPAEEPTVTEEADPAEEAPVTEEAAPAEEVPATEEVAPEVSKPEPPAKPAEKSAEKSAKEKPAEKFAGATEVSRVTDIHLQAVETLDIPEADKKKAQELSEEYVAVFTRNARRTAENRFWTEEAVRLHKLYDKNGAFRAFLADMTVLDDAEFPELSGVEVPLAKVMAEQMKEPVSALNGRVLSLKAEAQQKLNLWKKLNRTLIERKYLLFEIESNRHIVGQLASMLSVDKRWFWLCGMVAFGALFLASIHERRHEIRRWLNGGKARQMGLAKILTGGFIFILVMTLITFLMGEFLYRAMLDVTFQADSPNHMYTESLAAQKLEGEALVRQEKKVSADYQKVEKEWKTLASKNLRKSSDILESWVAWRKGICEISVQTALLEDIQKQIDADTAELKTVNGRLSSVAGDTLNFLRLKHILRFTLGFVLALATFLGIACWWNNVRKSQRKVFNKCPHCLSDGNLIRCDESGKEDARGSHVLCTKVVSDEPHEECGYRFAGNLRALTKLSFPTLGIPQVGKTHWLTMLYWEVLQGYYPELGFSCVESSVTEEMDRRIADIMNSRIGTAATQRDRIPLPLVLRYKDKDRIGRSDMLVNIFDYSGEITTDATIDDHRRARALSSDGFLFFLDPTYPWKPQADALRRFRRDLKSLKGLKENDSLHLPIAICLTKIDLLPLVTALGDSEAEAIRFYEELGRIDPTGIAMNLRVINEQSVATDELRRKIWPDWDMEKQITDLFGGRFKFFPLTPVGLDGVGETDLRKRTIAPFGLIEPLAWLLEMSGYPTLAKK